MTAAELLENYAQVRARLYGKPKRVNAAPRVITPPPPPPAPVIKQASQIVVRIPRVRRGTVIMRRIADRVCRLYEIPPSELFSKTRRTRVVMARHLMVYWIHRQGKYSLPQIGEFARRDHTSILHAIRAHEKRKQERNRKRLEKMNGRIG